MPTAFPLGFYPRHVAEEGRAPLALLTVASHINVMLCGGPPHCQEMLRRLQPVRTNWGWATDYARVIVQRAETAHAEAKRWRNEVRPVRADNRAGVPADATMFESPPLRAKAQQRQPKPNMTATFRWPKPQERRGTAPSNGRLLNEATALRANSDGRCQAHASHTHT